MPSKPHPCKICARFAPKKCKRHGGEGHPKTKPAKAHRGGRSSKPKPTAVPDNGHVDGAIAARVRGLVQAVANGKAAEAELSSIREAMGA